MTGVTFLPATEAHYPEICSLIPSEDELFLVYPRGAYPLTTEQLRHLAATRTDLTVAIQDGAVAGFADLYDLQPEKSAFIGNVVIDPHRRGQGVGRALMTYMIDRARGYHALPEVRVSVFGHNAPALLLYAGLGFSPFAVEPRTDYSGNRRALIHMRLCNPVGQGDAALADTVRNAVTNAALSAYEEAGMSGLCAEGRWECAVSAIRSVDIDALLCDARKNKY